MWTEEVCRWERWRWKELGELPGDDDDGDVFALAVLVEFFEAGVEFDVWMR